MNSNSIFLITFLITLKLLQPNRHLKYHNIDYLKLGTIFAWVFLDNEKPSVTNKEGFIIRSAAEYFSNIPSSRQINAVYNAWTKNIGGAKTYCQNLRRKSSVKSACYKSKVCVITWILDVAYISYQMNISFKAIALERFRRGPSLMKALFIYNRIWTCLHLIWITIFNLCKKPTRICWVI